MSFTPKYVQAMTPAEYKAWVETGAFPKRLEQARKTERAERAKAKTKR